MVDFQQKLKKFMSTYNLNVNFEPVHPNRIKAIIVDTYNREQRPVFSINDTPEEAFYSAATAKIESMITAARENEKKIRDELHSNVHKLENLELLLKNLRFE
jgi:hypothetical protein